MYATQLEPMANSERAKHAEKLGKKYPNLFNEVTWPWGPTRARFVLLKELPIAQLIANVNIVPRVDDKWLILRHQDGSSDVPGGTIEEGAVSLEVAMERFEATGRYDLAELYQFASEITINSFGEVIEVV